MTKSLKLPVTVKQLNSWIDLHFSVFRGPPRAYFELDFSIQAQWQEIVIQHRVIFLSIGLIGDQEECCLQIAESLEKSVMTERFVDAIEPLFIRHDFEWDVEERKVFGRIGFWRKTAQETLRKELCCYDYGQLPNRAKQRERL